MKMGRAEEARTILGRLRSESGNIEDAGVIAEYEEIVVAVEDEKAHADQNSYISMLFGINDSEFHVARRVQLSVWLQIIQEYVSYDEVDRMNGSNTMF